MNPIHVLGKLMNNKQTVVVGEYCVTPELTLHKSEIDPMFNVLDVDESIQQEIKNLFSTVDHNKTFYLIGMRNCRMSLQIKVITLLLEKYKSPQLLDDLYTHDNPDFVCLGMKRYTPEQLQLLVKHKSKDVRRKLATIADQNILMQLVNDKDQHVRIEVAKHGLEDVLVCLVNDECWLVRQAVAMHGYKDILDKLINDEIYWIRWAIAEFGHVDHLEQLVDDPSEYVRAEVAKHGDRNLLLKLVDDVCQLVRETASESLKNL